MATRTIANGGGNWTSTGSWVEGAVPASADDVVATSSSGSLVVDGTATCKSLNLTNYTATFSGSSALTVAGNVTLAGTITYSGTMTISAASTMRSNGKTFTGNITFTNSNTKTLFDNWTVTGLLTRNGTNVLNGNTMTVAGGLTIGGASTGTTTVVMTGGTWSGASYSIANNLTFNGNITIGSVQIVRYKTGTMTYTSGVINASGLGLAIDGSCTLNLGNAVQWNLLSFQAAAIVTMGADLYAIEVVSPTSGTVGIAGAYTLYCDTFQIRQQDTTFTIATDVVDFVINDLIWLAENYDYAVTIKSASAGSKAKLTYNGTYAGQKVAFCEMVDIDASGGEKIWVYNGTVTTCTNIETFDIRGLGGGGLLTITN